MTLNRYFNLGAQYKPNQEVNLVKGWVQESIQINGMDVYYIVRGDGKVDKLFGEDTQPKFETNYLVEAYLETQKGFDGPGDLLKMLGSVAMDNATIHMQRDRFQKLTGMEYPREGDLIFFPGVLNKGLWQISFVEDEQQFYPLGSKISFKLKLSLYNIGTGTFNTGIAALDARMQTFAPTNLQTLDQLEDVVKADNKEVQTESDVIVDNQQKGFWGKF